MADYGKKSPQTVKTSHNVFQVFNTPLRCGFELIVYENDLINDFVTDYFLV